MAFVADTLRCEYWQSLFWKNE